MQFPKRCIDGDGRITAKRFATLKFHVSNTTFNRLCDTKTMIYSSYNPYIYTIDTNVSGCVWSRRAVMQSNQRTLNWSMYVRMSLALCDANVHLVMVIGRASLALRTHERETGCRSTAPGPNGPGMAG